MSEEPFDRTDTDDDDIGPMQVTDWKEQWKKANFAIVELRIKNERLRALLHGWDRQTSLVSKQDLDNGAWKDELSRLRKDTREALKQERKP